MEATGVFQGAGGRAEILNRNTDRFEQCDFFCVAASGRPANHDLAKFSSKMRFLDQARAHRGEQVTGFFVG